MSVPQAPSGGLSPASNLQPPPNGKGRGALKLLPQKHRWRKLAAIFAGLLVVVWIGGDYGYSRYVANEIATWEATVEREQDGVEVGAQAYSLGDGRTAILLVHGINASPGIWRNMAPALADQGFTVRAMRLPGFAQPMDVYAAADREDWLAAVNAELGSLGQTHDRVILVGHSLGGALASSQVLEHPDSCDALVLLAPAVDVSSQRSPLLPVRWWHNFARWTLLFTTVTKVPFAADCHDPAGQTFAGNCPFTPRHTVDETFRLTDANRGRAGELSVPLLMILTEADQVIDTPAAREFYEAFGGERKELLYLPDSGHLIPLDYDWPLVVEAIGAFARSQTSWAN